MEPETMTTRTIVVRGQKVNIYYYELFLDLYKTWKQQGMSQEDIEDLLLS